MPSSPPKRDCSTTFWSTVAQRRSILKAGSRCAACFGAAASTGSTIYRRRTGPAFMLGCSGRAECRNGLGSYGGVPTRTPIRSDTGGTHVAAAGGNPVVVLFSRASDPGLCAPRGKLVHVLMQPDLGDISVETVFAACMAVAARPAK